MITIGILLCAVCAGPIDLRSGGRLQDPVTDATLAGLAVGGEAPRVISWDQVLHVTGEGASLARQYRAVSEKAWRARVRLGRGDATLAEPLFEELYEHYSDVDGPTAALVVEGLLRTRLRRGALASSVTPWLDLLAERTNGDLQAGERFRPAVMDEATGLSPALPPLWIPGASVEAFAHEAPPQSDGSNTALGALEILYRHLARRALGEQVSTPEIGSEALQDPGIQFVREIALALSIDSEERAGARELLEERLDDRIAPWEEAWIRAALGRSCLLEDDDDVRAFGMLHLVHLPARFGMRQPYLSGLALAEISAELSRQGQTRSAETVREELLTYGREHPALIWLESEMAQDSTEISMRREGR